MKQRFILGTIAAAFSLVTGCSTPLERDAEADAEQVRPSSSATHEALSIASWATFEREGQRFIAARADDGRDIRLFAVLRASESEVELRPSGEEHARVILRRDGTLSGTASEATLRVARALHDDAASLPSLEDSGRAEASAVSEVPEDGAPGLKTYALGGGRINYEAYLPLPWTVFGFRDDSHFGRGCYDGAQRSHAEAYMVSGMGNCSVTRWSYSNAYDCRVQVHRGVPAFQSGECYMVVYQF